MTGAAPPSDATPSAPAPGGLELVRAFVNTVNLEEDVEQLATGAEATAWLHGAGLLPADVAVDEAQRVVLIRFREALRALAEDNAHPGCARAELARPTVAELLAGAPLRVELDGSGTRLVPAAGPDDPVGSVVARLGAAIHDAVVAGTWSRLKACKDETCRWVFYDRSKNRSGCWCSMEVCGNRNKARSYRQRRRE